MDIDWNITDVLNGATLIVDWIGAVNEPQNA